MRLLSLLTLVVLLVAVPAVAHAEVMDKEPSVSQIWAWALLGGAALALTWRIRAWLGAVVTALVALFFRDLWSEITDPAVGPAIRAEAGDGYVTSATLATLIVVLLACYSCCRATVRGR